MAKISASTNRMSPIATATTGSEIPRDCMLDMKFARNESSDSAAVSSPVGRVVIVGEVTGARDGLGEVLGETVGSGDSVGTGMICPLSPANLVPVPLEMTPAVAAAQVKLLGLVAKRHAPW